MRSGVPAGRLARLRRVLVLLVRSRQDSVPVSNCCSRSSPTRRGERHLLLRAAGVGRGAERRSEATGLEPPASASGLGPTDFKTNFFGRAPKIRSGRLPARLEEAD